MGRPRKTLTVDEAAALMHVTHKRMLKLLLARRIYGARKIGDRWFIPVPLIFMAPKRKRRRRLDKEASVGVDFIEMSEV